MWKRFGPYIIAAIATAVLFIAYQAQPSADDLPDLWLENDMNGHIYLTGEPCDLRIYHPVADKLLRAYATWDEGTDHEQVHEACWFTPYIDLSMFPPDSEDRIIRFVYILTGDGRMYKSVLSDYEPVGQEKPKEGEF
jgi:hypothetical protein